MEKLLLLLKPFFELIKQLSSKEASISQVIPDVQMLDTLLAKEDNSQGVQSTQRHTDEKCARLLAITAQKLPVSSS